LASSDKKKVLILGASGMLGNTALRFFANRGIYEAIGSIRSAKVLSLFPKPLRDRIVTGIDVDDVAGLNKLFDATTPNVVINCIGVVKQLAQADDPLVAIPINSVLPHRLARLSQAVGARLVHLSTDCVFSGKKGMYREDDFADGDDLYGRSKYLGEVDYPNAITLRTSIIGHELCGSLGLLNWFLSQNDGVNGYTRAVFSGFPAIEIARVIHDFVIPNPSLKGVYQLSAEPIAKFDLLRLIADIYGKTIEIRPDDKVAVDRSLDSSRFREITGYAPPAWPDLVRVMHEFG
jgi:dTDP-4-dehydrorhamnose reductase